MNGTNAGSSEGERGERGGRGGGGGSETQMNSSNTNYKFFQTHMSAVEIEADVLALSMALDRLGLSDRAGAAPGLEARVAAASLEARASMRGADAAMVPASISIKAARAAAMARAPRRDSSGLLSPLRLAAGLALAAAVLGAVLAQRPAGMSRSMLAASGAGNGARSGDVQAPVALAGLTLADFALGEEILDVIAPVEVADASSNSAEGAKSAEFWSFDAFSEESL